MATENEVQFAFLSTDCKAMKDECNYSRDAVNHLFDEGDCFATVMHDFMAETEAVDWHLIGVFAEPFTGMLCEMVRGKEATTPQTGIGEMRMYHLTFDDLLDMERPLTEAVSYCVTHPLPNVEDDPDFDDIVNNATWFQQWTDTSTIAQRIAKRHALFHLIVFSV